MKEIPVTFEHNNQTHKGYLTLVTGGPGSIWHLMVNKFYWGKLFYAHGEWRFFSNHDPGLNQLGEYFGRIVTAWEDSPVE